MCFPGEHPRRAETKAEAKTSVPQVPTPEPLTAKQAAYLRAEEARQAKEKRRAVR
jgi:hypothetical protein